MQKKAWVGDPDQRSNQLAPQAGLNVRAFEKCRTLRTIGLERTEYNPRDPNRVIPEGCFLGTGLEMIDLPADFSWIGPAAFEHCTRLQTVDISRTGIQEIFFFHEYGRRVGMVPRSSLKEGKNRQMVEKGTKTPKPTQTKHPSPQAETPPSCSLSSTLGETCETETSGN